MEGRRHSGSGRHTEQKQEMTDTSESLRGDLGKGEEPSTEVGLT